MEARNIIADNYFDMLKNLSPDIKLELISRMSESMRTERTHDKESWKNLFGAFQSEHTAEEIIADLRKYRYVNREIEEL